MSSRVPQSSRDRFLSRFGRWAVITGASDGIGRALADELAAIGVCPVLVARRRPALEELAAELTERHDVVCRVLPLDLSQVDAGEALVAATSELDVGLLAACAGFGSSGRALDGVLAEELAMVDVNCRAVLEQALCFGERLVARGGGGLILMSSIVAFQGVPGAANYAATKAYVQSLAEALGRELKSAGVTVVAAAPGPVRSGFAARAGMHMDRTSTPSEVAKGILRALQRRGGTVRPGWLSKLLGGSLATLPRAGRVLMMERIMAGMSQPRGESLQGRSIEG
ncbi:MAG: SDR family NAD(P)-dependent oxidoreductase [Acidobacteriota bacterium]